jgi:hypothetical protein
MNMNKVTTEEPLPPEFPPAPVVGEFLAKTEEEYKEYMKKKMRKEQWDNAAVLYRMKRKANDKDGMKQVLDRISTQLKEAELSESSEPRRYTSGETESSRLDPDGGGDTEANLDKLFKELKEENAENPSRPPSVSPNLVISASPPLPDRPQSDPKPVPEPEPEREPEPEPEGSDSEDNKENSSVANRWYRSTIYNTFFFPIQKEIIIHSLPNFISRDDNHLHRGFQYSSGDNLRNYRGSSHRRPFILDCVVISQ